MNCNTHPPPPTLKKKKKKKEKKAIVGCYKHFLCYSSIPQLSLKSSVEYSGDILLIYV